MSDFCGVIAEFDPFHLGHARLLGEARRLTGCGAVGAVMSGCFTQRGAPALLSPHARAAMALSGGADIVTALPALWSLRDAERFALGGVAALWRMGCDSLCFGSESGDLPLLRRTADALEDPNPTMLAAIHSRLDAGMGYPAALQAALSVVLPEGAELLSRPNDTLAVCYLRAIRRLGADMTPFAVRRTGSYHDGGMAGAASSATAVRGAVLRGDWSGAAAGLTEEGCAILRREALNGRLHRPEALEGALLVRLRSMSGEEWEALPGASEGLGDRLRKAARRAASLDELLRLAGTRRYPTARLRRLCMHALLRIDEDTLSDAPLPERLQVLGFRRDSAWLLSRMGGAAAVRAADLPEDPAEDLAWDLWALGAGLPSGMRYTEPPVRG